MKSVVIYKRVSHVRQVEEGVSLEAQEAKLRAWCLANDAEVVACYADEGISGGKMTNRPGLARAMAHVTRIKGTLACYSLSRLCRSTKDAITLAERLKKSGCELVSLAEKLESGTAIGSFFFTLIAALGELERSLISERVKGAMDHLRSKDRRLGRHIPFGWSLTPGTKQLVRDEREQGIVETMKGWRVDGDSYAYIADRLQNALRVPTKQPGGRWTSTSVRRVLLREAKR